MGYEGVPLKAHRLGALFMSFAFGVIGGSVGLNALIKCVFVRFCFVPPLDFYPSYHMHASTAFFLVD